MASAYRGFPWRRQGGGPGQARRNGRALAGLLNEALPAWRDLAAEAGVSDLFRHEGCIYFYREKMPPKNNEWGARLRVELGVRQEWLNPAELVKLEPALPAAAGGVFFPDAVHIVDPSALTRRLADAAESNGASFRRARVERLEAQDSGQFRLICRDLFVDARWVVLAAGAWSRSLAQQGGENIPLDTERGYHIEFAMDACPIKRPVCPLVERAAKRAIVNTKTALSSAATQQLGKPRCPPISTHTLI